MLAFVRFCVCSELYCSVCAFVIDDVQDVRMCSLRFSTEPAAMGLATHPSASSTSRNGNQGNKGKPRDPDELQSEKFSDTWEGNSTTMDPLYRALHLFQRRRFEDASEACSQILAKNPYDQAAWCLKLRCLTEQVYVDEIENDEEGVAESVLDDNAISQVARPGTSLLQQKPGTASKGGGPSQAVRPRTQSGRPLTGVVRPGTQSGRPGTMEQALRTPRTARTARPVTASTGRFVRLGTASMISNPDGPFVNVSRLNFSKYAAQPTVAKPLFEYLFYHENDVRNALQLAALATQACQFKDWYWKVQLGKCYYRLGLYRDAEKQFKSALVQHTVLDTVLYLGKVHIKFDQPLTAIELYKRHLDTFPNDVHLLTALARIYEGLNDLEQGTRFYKEILKQEPTHIEAIACIGTNHFYCDQPELALRFFRRLLQMGVYNSEIFTNIALCCFYAQQFDLALGCVDKAITLAEGDNQSDVWYNVAHIALGSGDSGMAYQCFRLALSANHDNAEACCNLAVLEMRKGNNEQAKVLLQTAMTTGAYTFEPFYNFALLTYEMGDFQSSFNALKKALAIFPDHSDSKELERRLISTLASV